MDNFNILSLSLSCQELPLPVPMNYLDKMRLATGKLRKPVFMKADAAQRSSRGQEARERLRVVACFVFSSIGRNGLLPALSFGRAVYDFCPRKKNFQNQIEIGNVN